MAVFNGNPRNSLEQELREMMLTCVKCKEVFKKDDPVSVLCSNDGIYFFCSKECKDSWAHAEVAERELFSRGPPSRRSIFF